MPTIKTWPDDSIERRAYTAVADIPVEEENDGHRLGYHVYLFLAGEFDSVAEALHVAQPRLKISREEAVARIEARLREPGAPAA
jgi:hypothetical protein